MRNTGGTHKGAERLRRLLVAVVVAGAMVIAAIGFAGSYAAVRELAERKGFGAFAPFFPIGVDAGIVVLLALDLLLTWIRIPFPLLRQTAWLLTAATIAFNGAAAWPDPLGVGMHAVIPVLFVVTVEAARHATGRVAAITADKHMEGVRLSRWLLAFPSTFRLWRRMKLWELRNYDEVIRMEQDRLVYETRLRARYGRAWRRKAPVEALMPLKLTRYGIPLSTTAASAELSAGAPPKWGEEPRSEPSAQREPRSAGTGATRSRQAAADGRPSGHPPVPRAPGRGAPAGEEDGTPSVPGSETPGRDQGRTPRAPVAAAEGLLRERRAAPDESSLRGDSVPAQPSGDGKAGLEEGQEERRREEAAPAPTEPRDGSVVVAREQDVVGGRQREAHGATQYEKASVVGEGGPTLVDRYYQAWAELTEKLGTEPAIQDLSDHLWVRGMSGRGGGRISPSTLRRYRMGWRIYRVWAQYLDANGGAEPSLAELEELCAEHAIRSKGGRGNRLEQRDLAGYLTDFRRRYNALAGR
ncbi:DUF2637 domain-containing protein [Streptomyces smyrnaeus]|uniref:DUF2637 domain-containing protein n=1 Tax=Streptomyces smyrnaeus TaxID=1387713 RepID=UPI003692DC74